MKVGVQLQALAALQVGKDHLVSCKPEAGWIPQTVWTFLRRNISSYDSGLRDVILCNKELNIFRRTEATYSPRLLG
jgi:hypothetical protein